MPSSWIELEGGGVAHVNGDMSDPETAKAIQAMCEAAYKMLKIKETENDDPAPSA